jgi:hypothetical protein
MPRCSRLGLWFALLALLLPALAPASSQAARKHAKKKASSLPAEPVRPPLPQELPPVPPTVTFRGGQLSIVAPNSTLLDILTAVRRVTGAAVDAPASAARDRVATHLGPGQPREVLSALLDGSRFDYILLGSAEDPSGVRRLILTPRSGGGAQPGASETMPSAMISRPERPPISTDTGDEEESQPEQTVEPADEVAPEPQTPPPPEVKTPEQIQEELRQRQEQQRQQQEPPQPEPPQ